MKMQFKTLYCAKAKRPGQIVNHGRTMYRVVTCAGPMSDSFATNAYILQCIRIRNARQHLSIDLQSQGGESHTRMRGNNYG